MELSTWIKFWEIFYSKKGFNINLLVVIPLNKMVLPRKKIDIYLKLHMPLCSQCMYQNIYREMLFWDILFDK